MSKTIVELPSDLPLLPENWVWQPLISLVEPGRGISYGVVQPGSEHDESDGIPIIRVNNLHHGQIQIDDVKRISPEIENKYQRTRIRGGEILMGLVGTLGECAIAPDSIAGWNIARAVGSIPINSGIDPRWVMYCLKTSIVQHFIRIWANTTVQATLNLADVNRLPIPLPPAQERIEIVSILSSLDDKIELNRRMNTTLEETARALFKSWFVDFDPVRAKMEGRQPDGMDAETAALFPDRLVESELGPIPEGWSVGTLNEITDFVLGGDWGKDEPDSEATEPVYCIRGADIPDLQNAGFGKMPLRYLKASSLEKRSLRFGDLVVEISGGSPTQSTGRPVFIRPEILLQLGYPLACSNFCRLVRLNTIELSTYAYYWMSNLYSRDAFLQYETGTTGIKNFAFKIFSETHKMLIPPDDILKMYRDIIDGLQAQQHHNGNNSRTLAETRDALLPKLLSGEVRINEIETDLNIR